MLASINNYSMRQKTPLKFVPLNVSVMIQIPQVWIIIFQLLKHLYKKNQRIRLIPKVQPHLWLYVLGISERNFILNHSIYRIGIRRQVSCLLKKYKYTHIFQHPLPFSIFLFIYSSSSLFSLISFLIPVFLSHRYDLVIHTFTYNWANAFRNYQFSVNLFPTF